MAQGKCGFSNIGGLTFTDAAINRAVIAVGKIGLSKDGYSRGVGVLNGVLNHSKRKGKVTIDQMEDYISSKYEYEKDIRERILTSQDLLGYDSNTSNVNKILDLLNLTKFEYKDVNREGYLLPNNVVSEINYIRKDLIENGPRNAEDLDRLLLQITGMTDLVKVRSELQTKKARALTRFREGKFSNLPISATAIEDIRDVLYINLDDIIESGYISEVSALLGQLGKHRVESDIVGFDTLGELAREIITKTHVKRDNKISNNKNVLDVDAEIEVRARALAVNPINIENLRDDNGDRRFARDIMKKASFESYNLLSLKDIRALEQQRDNIESSYLSPSAYRAIRKLGARNKVVVLKPLASKAELKKWTISKGIAAIQNIGSEFTVLGTLLNTHPTFIMDQFVGNKISREWFEEVFLNIGKKNQLFLDRFREAIVTRDNLNLDRERIFKKEGLGPVKLASAIRRSNIRLSLYFNQRTNEYNKTQHGQPLDTLVDNVLKSNSKQYKEETKDIVEDVWVKDDYQNMTSDEMFEGLTPEEKNIVKWNDDVALELLPKFRRLATMHERAAPVLDKYHYLSFMKSDGDSNEDIRVFRQRYSDPDYKSPTTKERSHGPDAVINLLNPLDNIVKSIKMTYMDFYLTPEIQQSLEAADILAKEFDDSDGDAAEVTVAVKDLIHSFVDRDIANKLNTGKGDAFSSAAKWFEQVGYTIQLLSIEKTLAEIASNLTHILISRPKEFLAGVEMDMVWDKTGVGRRFIKRAGGVDVFDKLYAENLKYNSHIRQNLFESGPTKTSEQSNSAAKDLFNFAFEQAGGTKAQWLNDKVTEYFFITPERMLSLPLFWGTFNAEFERLSGKSMSQADFERIADNEEEYIKQQDHIDEALNEAAYALKYHTAPIEFYSGKGSIQIDPRDSNVKQILKSVNSYMQRFQQFEYASVLTGYNSMLGEGPMDPVKGAQLVAAGLARQILYFPILFGLQGLVREMLGEEDDEDDETFMEDLSQSALQALVNIVLMRNLLSFPREGMGQLIEWGNREFLGGLRDGERYDPWKHSIAFRVLSDRDINMGQYWKFSGPYSPLFKLLDQVRKSDNKFRDGLLGAAAYAKVLPLYKNLKQGIYTVENLK